MKNKWLMPIIPFLFAMNSYSAELGTIVAIGDSVGGDIESVHKCVANSASGVTKTCPSVLQKKTLYIVKFGNSVYQAESSKKYRVGDKVSINVNITLD